LAKTRSNGARRRRRDAFTPAACANSIQPRVPLRRALARPVCTARASMSLASTVTRSAFAAAIASTPLPLPRSSTRARGALLLPPPERGRSTAEALCEGGRAGVCFFMLTPSGLASLTHLPLSGGGCLHRGVAYVLDRFAA